MKNKLILSVFAAAAVLFGSAGCLFTPQVVHTLPYIKAEGSLLVDGDGQEVQLRGVNAGGLGVIEGWMTGFNTEESAPDDGTPGGDICVRDHYSISKVWFKRFDFDVTAELWDNYRAAWWTEKDFENCAKMGINVIRLPFTYMNVDFDAVLSLDNAGDFDFTFLDDFVNTAEKYGIYTILDLHGAYGSQNGQDHSGQIFDEDFEVTFYSDENLLRLTAELWGAVAEHFKDNPAVAGYDLLNEPIEKGSGTTEEKHWNALDMFYKAIRDVGDEHVVIFESCWDERGLPMPEEYGWENCMYSFHHYTGNKGAPDTLMANMDSRIKQIEAREFGVPLNMGEFTCYEIEEFWNHTLDLLNQDGWHWTSWTYKVWNRSGWGIYNINPQSQKVNVHYDSYSEILEKFKSVTTENGAPFTFESGKTLVEIFTEHCTADKEAE